VGQTAKQRQYYQDHREEILENRRAYRAENREQIRERMQRYNDGKRDDRKAAYTAEKRWAAHLRNSHRMTPGDYEDMWRAQNGCCYLCEEPLERGKTHIDHDHQCCPQGKSCVLCRRGLACKTCNWAIGHLGDDPDKIRRVADNLAARLLKVKEH
jgi:hypothetical protein